MKVDAQLAIGRAAVVEEIEEKRLAASDGTVEVKALRGRKWLNRRILRVEVGKSSVRTV